MPDPDLNTAVRNALQKPPREALTAEDLAQLVTLNAEGNMGMAKIPLERFYRRAERLDGLEHAVNLQVLNLNRNEKPRPPYTAACGTEHRGQRPPCVENMTH